MITNELMRLKATKYWGTAGKFTTKEFLFGTYAISYIEETDDKDGYIIHLQGDNSLYFVTEDESKEKLKDFIKSNVM